VKRSRVVVKAPATSANMGPGFDALGIALGLYDEFSFAVLEAGPSRAATYDISKPLAGGGFAPPRFRVPTDASNLAIRAFRLACADLGVAAPEVDMTCMSRIPVSRGLGSSAAAITAGVTAAWAMFGDDVDGDVQRRLDLAARLEGHPDNTSACILGGMVASAQVASGVLWARVPVQAALEAIVAVPDVALSTSVARNVLPPNVPHSDAVFNVGRVALLVASLASGELHNLRWATEDRLHQPYRACLTPGTAAAVRVALEAGALGAYVSGAGPSAMALTAAGAANASSVAEAMRTAFTQVGVACTILHLPMGAAGAGVVEAER
jgi:homoserine kinase